jgi:hypothetical protein
MIKWFKDFLWFVRESKHFMSYNNIQLIRYGGLRKAVGHANFMRKWRKMTTIERELWYLNENRVIDF